MKLVRMAWITTLLFSEGYISKKKNHNTAFKSRGHRIFHEENADLGNMFLQKGMPTTALSETVKEKMV